MRFDLGVTRIYYDVTGWHSFASFELSGDEFRIFIDAYCPEEVGRYS
jgi:hypothetical protein